VNHILIYVALSLAFSSGGFTLGFMVGRGARDVLEHPMTSPLSEHPVRPVQSGPRAEKSGPWYRRSQTWIGGLVALIGAVVAVQWQVQGARTDALVKCQQAYSNGFSDALNARAKAQAQVNDAQDTMWVIFQQGLAGTLPQPEIRANFQRALDAYLAGRAQSKAAPPLPEPPRDLCK